MRKRNKYFGYETAEGFDYPLIESYAVEHRKAPTDAERFLWKHLSGKQLGLRFRRQHVVGDYVADFICLPLNLVIEVDGGYHFVNDIPLKDEEHSLYLSKRGYHILRFTNEEVLFQIDKVVNQIKAKMSELPNLSKDNKKNKSGKVLVVCAPSGTGKSTIIQYLQSVLNQEKTSDDIPIVGKSPSLGGVRGGLRGGLGFSISATTREPRGEERDGVEYFFLTEEEFQQKIEEDAFIEWEQVYAGQKYGTLKEQVESQLSAGKNIVFDVDVNGGLRIKEYFGERALSLFILPPSIDALRERLEKRGTETPEKIQKRIDRAEYEISRAPEFDCRIVNDDLATAEAEALRIVSGFLML